MREGRERIVVIGGRYKVFVNLKIAVIMFIHCKHLVFEFIYVIKINDAPFQMSTGKIQLGINTDHAINHGTVCSVETTTLILIEGKRHCWHPYNFF